MLQGYAVTLTFKVAIQMLHATRRRLDTTTQYGDPFCEIFLKPSFNYKVMGLTWFCCKVMLWPSRERPKCGERHVASIWWSFLWNSFEILLQITKLWARHDFAARSCCVLDLQGSVPNVARDTTSQYGDHFCEICFKFNFKKQSYGPDTILLQGRAVTLTFKVETQMLCPTRRLNMVVISVN